METQWDTTAQRENKLSILNLVGQSEIIQSTRRSNLRKIIINVKPLTFRFFWSIAAVFLLVKYFQINQWARLKRKSIAYLPTLFTIHYTNIEKTEKDSNGNDTCRQLNEKWSDWLHSKMTIRHETFTPFFSSFSHLSISFTTLRS